MSSLAIEALTGTLTRALKMGELVELMAYEDLGEPSPDRRAKALAVLRSLGVGPLRPRKIEREREVPGVREVFVPWDSYRDSPLDRDKIDAETGRAGRWDRQTTVSGQGGCPPGSRPVFETVVEELFDAEDVAALLKGKLGEAFAKEDWTTEPLKAWCKAAGEQVEKPMARRDIAATYVFVRPDGTVGKNSYSDIGELARKGSAGKLKTTGGDGMFLESDVRDAARRHGWKMQAKGAVRGSVGRDGEVDIFEVWRTPPNK